MKAEIFYELLNKQNGFSVEDKSHLQQVMLSVPFLRACRTVMQKAAILDQMCAKTLPTPEKVLEIAFNQGMSKGMYSLLDDLIALTEYEEKKDG